MRPVDIVWNRAAFASQPNNRAGLRAGDRALAGLLQFHGRAMNGGVLFALAGNDELTIREAADGYRYFGFDEIAAMVERAFPQAQRFEDVELGEAESLEEELESAYAERIPGDQVLVDAFERSFNAQPEEYAPAT